MSLHPDCLARLKLRQPPFEAVPNEEFLYSDPLLESLIETAIRALAAPGAVVMLAGADGSGRSIQLMRLLGALGDHFELIAFRGRANIAFSAVDATIRSHLQAIGLNHPARALTDLLAERGRAGVAPVLAIDDAQLIGMDIIERLLRLRSEILEANGQGLRLVLVGNPSLNRAHLPFQDPADENQVVRLNLRPFNLEQAGAYLRHRLRVAGCDDPETFLTSGDIAVLQTSSKGIPAALNLNANAWLARRCRSANGIRKAMVGTLRQSLSPATAERTGTSQGWTETSEGILDLDSADDVYAPSDPELSRFLVHEEDERLGATDFEQVLRQIRQKTLLTEADSSPPPKPEGKAPTPEKTPRYWNRPWFIPALLGIVIVSILVPVVSQLEHANPRRLLETAGDDAASAHPPLVAVTPEPVVPPPDAATPLAVTVAEPAPTPDHQPAPPVIATETAPRIEQTPPAASPAQPLSVGSQTDLDADRAWLLRQEPGRFTIQLVAARDLSIAREFTEEHQLDGVHFIQTRSFIIGLIGSYPNRIEADNALHTLPTTVRANGPWIRTIGSILESQR